MKLKTSLVNATVLKKDLTRFAPLWGIYTVLILLYLLLMGSIGSVGQQLMKNASYIMMAMAPIHLVYGALSALLLFGDLHKSRICNMLHAMPLRRESWFATHILAGMLFCLLPTVVGGGIAALMLGQYAYGAALWLALMVLEYLFFFGAGCLSMLCTGTGPGAVMVYAIFNSLGGLSVFLVNTFFMPYLKGIKLDQSFFRLLSPVSVLSESDFLHVQIDHPTGQLTQVSILPEPWIYLGVVAAIGIVFMGLALLIYRKRHLESAGNLIAFRPAAPVFLVLYTLLVGAVFFLIATLTEGILGFFFLVVGLALGFFTGKMMLEKTVNVFRPKNFLGFGIVTAALILLIGLTALDPMDLTRYVPDPGQVTAVTVSPHSTDHYNFKKESYTTAKEEDIQKIAALHRAILNAPADTQGDTQSLMIQYRLKSGTTLTRFYNVGLSMEEASTLCGFYSTPTMVLHSNNPNALLPRITALHIYPNDGPMRAYYRDDTLSPGSKLTEEERMIKDDFGDDPQTRALVEALFADCRAGTLPQYYTTNPSLGYITIEYLGLDSYEHTLIHYYETSENTLACLEKRMPQP